MHEQDSTDPTGVSGDTRANNTIRARQRKSNAAVALRLAGAQWGEIARTLGYPTARAAAVATEKALERELRTPEGREKARALVGARLDRLLRSVWSKAINEESPEHLPAVGKAREIIGDHRKLYGLDAPTEMIVHSPTQSEIEQWVSRVVSVSTEVVEEFDIIDGEVLDSREEIEA